MINVPWDSLRGHMNRKEEVMAAHFSASRVFLLQKKKMCALYVLQMDSLMEDNPQRINSDSMKKSLQKG